MTIGQSARDALESAEAALRSGEDFLASPWPTGFDLLDKHLGGGISGGSLVLLGGPQGLGKTTFALQIARNVVAAGGHCVYVCYEHGERELLERLIGMEAGLAGGPEAMPLSRIRERLRERADTPWGLSDRLSSDAYVAHALASIKAYGDRLVLARASGSKTGIDEIRHMIAACPTPPLVVVDYLQKVAVPDAPSLEDDRITVIVESLKDLAMDLSVAVLAIVAADKAGVGAGRTRLHHLRGSTALAYEADVALLLNDKYDIVARHHLVFGTSDIERFRKWVICSIEKNRSGLDSVDMQFRKVLQHGHFDPRGEPVAEQLIDDRIYRE